MTTTSKDGTRIAFDRAGQGPAVIFVDGALCYRASGPSASVAGLLKEHFTVYTYDRRGRGDSGDTAPYAIEREVDDIAALIAEAGGTAYLFGVSSGAVLALDAASRLTGISRLALYEAPFIVDDTRPPLPSEFRSRLKDAVAADRRSDAVAMFLKLVGVPGFGVAIMRLMPVWKTLTASPTRCPTTSRSSSRISTAVHCRRCAGRARRCRRWRSTAGKARPTCATGCGRSRARCRARPIARCPARRT